MGVDHLRLFQSLCQVRIGLLWMKVKFDYYYSYHIHIMR